MPVIRTVLDPYDLAFCKPNKTFLDFPDVDNPIASPRVFFRASICREKTNSKSTSFDHAEITEGFATNEIALIAVRFLSEKVQVNSPAKWFESEAEPPLPNIAVV